ncbi:MAG: hypothetical protein O7D30_08925, partial [Rickettsia endosymbiont of Ixodes persulcatus]|nr:hypothetical protein [Rickettsia endosymbiont of Ixodes persulcatus]
MTTPKGELLAFGQSDDTKPLWNDLLSAGDNGRVVTFESDIHVLAVVNDISKLDNYRKTIN